MSTAVFIKSSSCDSYLYSLESTLSYKAALDFVKHLCPEEPECWDEVIVVNHEEC